MGDEKGPSPFIPITSTAPLNYSPPSPSHYLLNASTHPTPSSSNFFSEPPRSNHSHNSASTPFSSVPTSSLPSSSPSTEDLSAQRLQSQLLTLKSEFDVVRRDNKELKRELTLTRSQLRDSESEAKITSMQLSTELSTLRQQLSEREAQLKEDERRLLEMSEQLVKAQTAAEHEITFFNLEVEKEIARSKQERELQKMKVEAAKRQRATEQLQAELRKLKEAAKAGNYAGVDLSDEKAREELREARRR